VHVKAFIFDLDGTLIDSVEAHIRSWAYALRKLGFSVNEEKLKPLIGLSGKDILTKLYGQEILKYYINIRKLKDRAFLHELSRGGVQLFPGVIKLLKILKNHGMRIAIASSTPNYLLMHICDYLGISDYVDLIVGGDEVSRGKPYPDLFIRTIKLLGIKAKEVAIVGDTIYDVKPANEVGAISILVNNIIGDNEVKPKYHFRYIHSMIGWVLSWNV